MRWIQPFPYTGTLNENGDGMIQLRCRLWPCAMKVETNDLRRVHMLSRLSPGETSIEIHLNGKWAGEALVKPATAETIYARLRHGWRIEHDMLAWGLEGVELDNDMERTMDLIGVRCSN